MIRPTKKRNFGAHCGVIASRDSNSVASIRAEFTFWIFTAPPPGWPLKQGRAGTLTHDYQRHGITTWFAALNTLDGTVVATQRQRHRHQEWLRFLALIEQQTPQGRELHLIVDNDATPQAPALSPALHAHQCCVAQRGGAMLPRPDGKTAAPQRLQKPGNSCRPPSPPTSRGTTKIRARSSGPPKPRTMLIRFLAKITNPRMKRNAEKTLFDKLCVLCASAFLPAWQATG